MTTNNHRSLARAALIAAPLLFAALTGCATVAPTMDNIVAERAQARWDAILSRDYATAYSYYSPGFRAKFSATDLEIKVRLQKVRWTSAKVKDQTCDGDTCTVRVNITYQVGAPVPGVDTWNGFDLLEEQWVKTGGDWWYIPPKG